MMLIWFLLSNKHVNIHSSTNVIFLQQEATLPCDFRSYDANNDDKITIDEFLSVVHGNTRVRPDVIFARMDVNRMYRNCLDYGDNMMV